MDELIERIEKAEAGSRELDWEIFCQQQPQRLAYYEKEMVAVQSEAEANGTWDVRPDAITWHVRGLYAPRYTTSIDAAMTLADGLSEQQIWVIWNDALAACSCAEKDMRKDVARFWCAAALRAQTTIAGDE